MVRVIASSFSCSGDLNRFRRIGNDFRFHGAVYNWGAAEHTSPVRVCSDLLLAPVRSFVIVMDPSQTSAGDRELQDFLAQEQQKLQFQNQVSRCVMRTGLTCDEDDRSTS